jgi:hypothetical protein
LLTDFPALLAMPKLAGVAQYRLEQALVHERLGASVNSSQLPVPVGDPEEKFSGGGGGVEAGEVVMVVAAELESDRNAPR